MAIDKLTDENFENEVLKSDKPYLGTKAKIYVIPSILFVQLFQEIIITYLL